MTKFEQAIQLIEEQADELERLSKLDQAPHKKRVKMELASRVRQTAKNLQQDVDYLNQTLKVDQSL